MVLGNGVNVGIGTSSPDNTALLELNSTDKGFLPPRMNAAEIWAISGPANGLMVFNNDDDKIYVFVAGDGQWKALAYETGTLAYYSIGSGGSCDNTIVHGFYPTGYPLNGTNVINIDVSVYAIGDWSITTDIVNGFSFSGGGTFTSTGILTVTLYGSGTPTLNQTDVFTATADAAGGNSTCIFEVTSTLLQVGDIYGGGVVFYLGNAGGGLTCALNNQSYSEWGCYGNGIAGANGIAIGTGAQNTIDIELECETPGTAADVCANLFLNGYGDWFLPSKDELNAMYQNKTTINASAQANGGSAFTTDYYWSSSETTSERAWIHGFHNDVQGYSAKDYKHYVRCVRTF